MQAYTAPQVSELGTVREVTQQWNLGFGSDGYWFFSAS